MPYTYGDFPVTDGAVVGVAGNWELAENESGFTAPAAARLPGQRLRGNTKTDLDKCGFFSSLCGSAGLIGSMQVGPAKCGLLERSGYDNIMCTNELNCIACIPSKWCSKWLRVRLKCDLSSADGSME